LTITSSFFDHQKYPAQEFINRDKDFIGNGVLHPATDFALTYNNNMTVTLGSGTSWANGMRIGYDANPALTLTFATADTTNPRVDLIEVGTTGTGTQGQGVIQIVKGVPASTPLQPQPDSGFVGLYAVLIPANATQVSSLNITDLRAGISISGATNTPLSSSVPGTQTTNTTGSAGVSTYAARADHVHPMPNINVPVSSVNGKTGDVTLAASDVGAIATSQIGVAGGVAKQDDLTSHEAEIASQTQSGHIKVDGITTTVNSNGVLSTIDPGALIYMYKNMGGTM
jgi:hypothetical protein